jgi:hypothetical protein
VTADSQRALKQAFRLFFLRGMTRDNALAEVRSAVARTPEVQDFLRFMESPSRRGLASAELRELGRGRPFEVVGGKDEAAGDGGSSPKGREVDGGKQREQGPQ